MLRLVSKRLVPAAVLGLALTLPLAGHADPVVRLSIASPHDIDTYVGDFAKLGEKPEKATAAREIFVKTGVYDGAGIDTTKRIGLVLNVKDGAPPAPTIIISVTDETKFLAAFKPFYPQQEKLPDGRWKLMTEKMPPLAIRIDKGWGFVNILSEAEVPPQAEPEKLIAGRGMIDLYVSVSSIPEGMKQQVIGGIKSGGESKAAAMTTDAEKAQAKAGTDAMVAAMTKFFAQTESLGFVLALSTQEYRLDFEMHSKAGVPAATAAPGAPIGLAKLVPATAAVGFTSDMSLDEMARTAMKDSAKSGFDAARKQGGPPSKLKFLDAMEAEVQNLVATGRVEGIAMVDGKKGDANVVLAIRTAPDSKMNDAIKTVVEEVSKKPDAGPKPTIKTDGALTIYSMESPNKSMSADLGGAEITLAVRPGLMTMALGAKTIDKIKALLATLDGTKPDAVGTIGSTKGWFGVRTFTDIAGVSTFAKTKADEELFNKYVTAGADQLGFLLEPQKDGYKSGLYMQGGLVALFARSVLKDSAGAPAPDAVPASGAPDVAPASVTPTSPEAPAAPASVAPSTEAPAAPASAAPEATPSADASPAASPSASPAEGEGEKGEKGEKKEEGEK